MSAVNELAQRDGKAEKTLQIGLLKKKGRDYAAIPESKRASDAKNALTLRSLAEAWRKHADGLHNA